MTNYEIIYSTCSILCTGAVLICAGIAIRKSRPFRMRRHDRLESDIDELRNDIRYHGRLIDENGLAIVGVKQKVAKLKKQLHGKEKK